METPERPLATAVGDAFVQQYYYYMKNFPEELLEFYGDNSTITRPGHDGTMRSSYSLDIGESLNTLSFGGFDSVVVTNVISEDSSGRSVMVIVKGYFISNESVEKNFSQTFLLAPQETGYFVYSDVFIFLDKPEVNDGTKVVSREDSKASIPPADNEGGKYPETEITRSKVAGDELKDVPKLSYASVLMKETPKNQSHTSCDPSPRREAAAVVDRGDRNNQKSHGIFIRNLHPNTTDTMIQNAFQQFGEVTKVVKRLHLAHRLVMFKEAEAAQKAIEASPMMINRRQVTVEKLRPRSGGGIRGQGTRG